jgi:hypothetical protein
MNRRRWLGVSLALWAAAYGGHGSAQAPSLHPLGEAWQSLPLRGRALYRFWGLQIYEATLWLPAEAGTHWSSHRHVLSLLYHRDFSAQDIAQRSVQEIQRQGPLAPNLATAWLQQLTAVLTDVRAGERLTAGYDPQRGLRLWHQAQSLKPLGQIEDLQLAQKFMGIWLSPATSAPELRQALLGVTS